MVSLLSALGLLFIVGLHTFIAAVATRFFRLRLETDWGAAFYTLTLIPIVLLASTLALSGGLGLGPNLGSQATVLTVVIALPFALGYSIDVFWMPHPDDVELPDTTE